MNRDETLEADLRAAGEAAAENVAEDAVEDAAPEDAAAAPEPPLETRVEALLFASDEPVGVPRLAQLAAAPRGDVLEAIDRLNVFYAETARAFRIASIAGGFQLVTTPELAPVLAKLRPERHAAKLSRAGLETLAIIAFKQPVTRAEIDAIRGVSASDRVLRHLLERDAIRIAGRAEAPGRPLLYGTTKEFLQYFGLASLSDLPRTDELAALLAGDRAPVPPELEETDELDEEGARAHAAAPERSFDRIDGDEESLDDPEPAVDSPEEPESFVEEEAEA